MKTTWIMSAAAAGTSGSTISSGGSVVIVGLNAALQKRFVLAPNAPLIPGNVHRASEIQVGVGGKGQDVGIALSCLPYRGRMQLAQFIGSGAEGDTVQDLLRERFDTSSDDVLSLTVRPASHMRTCTTIVASDVSTELVEPSGTIEKEDMDEMFAKLGGDKSTPAAGVCIMGSMPPGCPEDSYATIYRKTHGPQTLCLIDSVVGLDQLLQTIASSDKRGPIILKLNAAELCRLARVETSSTGEADGMDPGELVNGITGFLRKFHPSAAVALNGIAITDGKHPSHFVVFDKEEYRVFRVSVPVLDSNDRTLYPIGAGDTVAAGTLAAWKCLVDEDEGSYLDETIRSELLKYGDIVQTFGLGSLSTESSHMMSAFAFGLACGSASCLEEQNSIFVVDEALALYREMAPPASVMVVPFDAT